MRSRSLTAKTTRICSGWDACARQVDARVFFVGAGHFECGLTDVDGAYRIVPGLFAHGLGLIELEVPVGFALILRKLRLGLTAACHGRVVGGFIRGAVDHKERVALFDAVAFFVGDFFQSARDLRHHIGLTHAFGFAQGFDPDIFVRGLDGLVGDRKGRSLRLRFALLLTAGKQKGRTKKTGTGKKMRAYG